MKKSRKGRNGLESEMDRSPGIAGREPGLVEGAMDVQKGKKQTITVRKMNPHDI